MATQIQKKLRVYPLWKEDVFKDIARLPEQDREGIREGSICAVSINGHTKRLIVRGLEEQLNGGIMLDAITRKALGGLQEGMSYEFTIKQAGVLGQIRWACTVADRGARISAWIGLLSLTLGILGVFLGVISVWLAEFPPR